MGRDGFGYRGVRLTPEPGGHTVIEVERTAIARRLGRLTGAGLFAESQKLGRERDWPESGVMGADTVQVARYRGRLFWLWGDTHLPNYPLGIFHSSAATTVAGPLASLEPPVKIVFDYFRDPQSGRPREVGRMPGDGPTWITGMASVPDVEGVERLVGTYSKIEPPLDAYTFYNPRMHPYLVPEGAGVILFDATYTEQFGGDPVVPTARHDYNQVLYRIDLDNPRLGPARR